MSEGKAVTKTVATRYRRAGKSEKRRILDELCATTGGHRDYARQALRVALRPKIVRSRRPRPPMYGPKVIAALIFCWAGSSRSTWSPHGGGNAAGEHAWTLRVTDIATGWTENHSVPNKAGKWVLAALYDIASVMPFPILGVESDNGSEFINHHLLAWCGKRKITFTRSRPGNSNDACHVEQKNWAIVRIVVGYHRYDTEAQLLLLNMIWVLQSQLTNYFYPQQKLMSKVRVGAKVTKKYDTAATPRRRAERHDGVSGEDKAILADTYTAINPAAVQRQIQALTNELLTLTISKAGPGPKAHPTRASVDESTNRSTRAP